MTGHVIAVTDSNALVSIKTGDSSSRYGLIAQFDSVNRIDSILPLASMTEFGGNISKLMVNYVDLKGKNKLRIVDLDQNTVSIRSTKLKFEPKPMLQKTDSK